MFDPDVKCKKCRNTFWSPDVTPLTWTCIKCGNTLNYRYGTFFQQIDDILNSHRSQDFAPSTDNKAIQAKPSLDIKKIRYNRYLHRKKNPNFIV
ncbi:MAG: hypothetical protein ACLFUH_10600 [Bacteroidales bacterium]